MPTTEFLSRHRGHVAYDDTGGAGVPLIAAPGLGDLRQVYRHLAPELVAAGVRLVTMDLRGTGESSAGWDDYSDTAVASDYLALVDAIGAGPAVLMGNSLSCASAVIAATEAPEKVAGLVLLGPFVRPVAVKWWQKAAFAALLAPPWGRWAWVSYHRRMLYPGPRPADLDEHVAALGANLAEPGRMAALRGLAANTHEESGRRLGEVTQPVLVVMGTADPDFPDPRGEAHQLGAALGAEVLAVEGSGHYPQADRPDVVAPAVVGLVRRAVP